MSVGTVKLAFINTLTSLAEADPRIILLTGDLGYQIFDAFHETYPDRYVNVGVAEAQMMDAAAGLTHEGFRPFTYSIASFATARCFEQIKLSLAYHGLPVVVVGAGGGYAYGHSGVTHHAGEDMALMRSLPGMAVVCPGDVNEVKALTPQLLNLEGPAYFRIGRGKEPEVLLEEPICFGKARLMSAGEDVAILCTGEAMIYAHRAIDTLHGENIWPMAYQFHTVKPLDVDVLADLCQRVGTVLVVETHNRIGGLGSAVAEFFAGEAVSPRLVSLSVPDCFVLGSPSQQEIAKRYGMDSVAIVEKIRQLISEKRSWNRTHTR
jgi:transketolase